MTAFQYAPHLPLDRRNVFRVIYLSVQNAQYIDACVIFHEREWNNDGFIIYIRKTKGGYALAKHTDDRKRELAHANASANGIIQPEHAIGDLLGNEANLAAACHVRVIEVTPTEDHQSPNRLIALGDANQVDWAFASTNDNCHGQLARPGNLGYAGDCGFDRIHIIEG